MSLLAAGLILLAEESGKQNPYTQIIFVVGAALAILFLLKISRKNRNAAAMRAEIEKAGRPEKPERYGGHSRVGLPEGQQDPEVAKLYIELNEFARELEGRMDTKIAYLRKLLAEAERVIGELDRSIACAGRAIAAAGKREDERAPAPEGEKANPPAIEGSPSAEKAEHPPATIDITIGEPAGSAAGSGGTAKSAQEDVREKILRLAGEGKPKEAIVGEVGLPKGEVELVLSLHKAKKSSKAKN